MKSINYNYLNDPLAGPERNKETKVLAIMFMAFCETPEFTELVLKYPEVQETYKRITDYCDRKFYEQQVKDKFEQFKKDLSPEELVAFEAMCR